MLAGAPAGRVLDAEAPATDLTVFAEGALAGRAAPTITGLGADGEPWSSAGAVRWRSLASHGGGRLFATTLPGPPGRRPMIGTIDVSGAVTDFVNPAPVPQRSRALGIAGLLP